MIEQFWDALNGPARWTLGAIGALALGVIGNLLTPFARTLPTLIREGRHAARIEKWKTELLQQVRVDLNPAAALADLIFGFANALAVTTIGVGTYLALGDAMAATTSFPLSANETVFYRILTVCLALVFWLPMTGRLRRLAGRFENVAAKYDRLRRRAEKLGIDFADQYEQAKAACEAAMKTP